MSTSRRTLRAPGTGHKLRPTWDHARRSHYLRSGGPWRVGSLDTVLSAPGPTPSHRVVDGDSALGGAALEQAVASVAGGLRSAGVRRGDGVAWQLPNGLPAVVLYRACWRLGAVALPIHAAARESEVERSLEQAPARLTFAAQGSAMAERGGAITVPGGMAGLDAVSEALPAGPPVGPGSSARPTDLAVVMFTSGSTGRPKAVLHTQRGLAWKAGLMARVHGLSASDAVLMPAPMAHVSGLLNGVLLPAVAGMRTVCMARWDPDHAVSLVESERITFMIGPPTFFVTMMGAGGFTRERVRSLRLVSSGGAAVTPAFVDTARRELGCVVKRTYGSTEAPTVTTSAAGDDPARARDTDGRAVGEVELRISDPDTGKRVVGGPAGSVGSAGELWVRGPELFVGYADPADNEARRGRGGWFRTGDLAVIEEGGWLRIVGRLGDVIIRGGENIAATEVEAVLESHPLVRHAAAVAVPDPVMGERVAAVLVAGPSFDLDACRRYFAEEGLARFKTPEHLVLVDHLPTLASGKINRAACRELAARSVAGASGSGAGSGGTRAGGSPRGVNG
ncbi:MAG: class I adenylate-forming enzyme family protein [Actinomycetota bacterium]|nr:class I adenylate-forming enzyme family protein [Actinomycetota bacterium]